MMISNGLTRGAMSNHYNQHVRIARFVRRLIPNRMKMSTLTIYCSILFHVKIKHTPVLCL